MKTFLRWCAKRTYENLFRSNVMLGLAYIIDQQHSLLSFYFAGCAVYYLVCNPKEDDSK